jgi:sugar phosphate isomerase/epimerase
VKEACDAAGLPVVSYTIGADFLNGSGGDWRAEVERLKDEVRIAQALGCSRMRHDAAWGFPKGKQGARGFDDALPILAEGCRAVTEFAADLGIYTMVENHGYFAQDSDRVEKLINAVDHPNFGLLLDVGNFLCVDENPAQAVGKLLPYVFHVHVKDFHFKTGLEPDPGEGWFPTRSGNYLRGAVVGHGVVPVVQCLRLLKTYGYDGALSIEFEGMEEPVQAVRIGLANLRRYLKSIE